MKVEGRIAQPYRPSGPSPGSPFRVGGTSAARRAVETHLVHAASPKMEEVYRQLRELARTTYPVLLSGETGVGKEHLARLVHDASARAAGPYVAINCAAIPADLLEAELFGIERGVATEVGARPGRFRESDGGTLFLDEVGDLPLAMQAKLLRALDSGEIQTVGGVSRSVDTRIVAATNAPLRERMAENRFRADLFYRLAGLEVSIPPLRERPEDLELLIDHFLARYTGEAGKRLNGLTPQASERLLRYPWPGNVRELQNEVRRMVYLCPEGAAIDLPHMSRHLRKGGRAGPGGDPSLDLAVRVAQVERAVITEALQRTGGNKKAAAELVGLSRNGLALKMKRLGLSLDLVLHRKGAQGS